MKKKYKQMTTGFKLDDMLELSSIPSETSLPLDKNHKYHDIMNEVAKKSKINLGDKIKKGNDIIISKRVGKFNNVSIVKPCLSSEEGIDSSTKHIKDNKGKEDSKIEHNINDSFSSEYGETLTNLDRPLQPLIDNVGVTLIHVENIKKSIGIISNLMNGRCKLIVDKKKRVSKTYDSLSIVVDSNNIKKIKKKIKQELSTLCTTFIVAMPFVTNWSEENFADLVNFAKDNGISIIIVSQQMFSISSIEIASNVLFIKKVVTDSLLSEVYYEWAICFVKRKHKSLKSLKVSVTKTTTTKITSIDQS